MIGFLQVLNDDQLHSQGKTIWDNGETWVGKFKDGEFWNEQYFNKDGSRSSSKTVNGKFITK